LGWRAARGGLVLGNGFGKLIGATQLVELGIIETPILLVGTLSAFRVADASVTYMLGLPGNEHMITVNPVDFVLHAARGAAPRVGGSA
jgi:D-aminopeptidase